VRCLLYFSRVLESANETHGTLRRYRKCDIEAVTDSFRVAGCEDGEVDYLINMLKKISKKRLTACHKYDTLNYYGQK
jgi:hypothetical protein